MPFLFVSSFILAGCGDDRPPMPDTGIGFDATPSDASPDADGGMDDSSVVDGSADGGDSGSFDAGMLSPGCYAPAMETDLGERFPDDPAGIDVTAETSAFTLAYPDLNGALVLQRFQADGTPDGEGEIPFSRRGQYSFPSLSHGSTDLAAAFLTTEPGFRQVRVATRDHASTSFRVASRISPMGHLGARTMIGEIEGGFALAYSTRESSGATHLYYARLDTAGALLGMPTEVATSISVNAFDLARDGEGTAVVWRTTDGSGSSIWIQPAGPDGVLAPSAFEVVSGRRITGRPAAVRAPGGATLVAWSETVGSARSEIHALLFSDTGMSMFTERIASGIEQGTEPDLAAMPLAVGLAYRGMPTEGPTLRFRLLTFDGEALIDPMTVGAIATMGGEVAIGASQDARSFGIGWTDIDSVSGGLETRFVTVLCGG